MSIIPENITTVRVDQLPNEPATLSSLLPHQVGTELKQTSVSDFISLVATAIESGSGVGFLPVTVSDGQILPPIPENPSFILVGAGTYGNLDGFPDLVCTENLNALITVGTHWEISVEIPITPLTGSVQSVTGSAVDNTDPLNPVINLTGGSGTTPTLQEVLMQGGREVFKIDDAEETYTTTEEDKGRIIFIPSSTTLFTSIIIDDVYEIGDTLLIYSENAGREISALLSGSFIPDYTTSLYSNVGELISITLIGNDGTQNLYTYNVMPYQVGAGASWGSIIGTLANQTDLQTALNGKKNIDVVISSNTTASNDTNYSVVANATFTDPTPVEGKGYMVTVINGTATIGGVGYTVGQKVFRHYHSGSWRTFVTQNASSLSKIVIKDTVSSSAVTGSTLNTLAKTYEIQGGVFDGNDAFNLEINAEKSSTLGTSTIRVYVNTVNNFATATLYSNTQSIAASVRDIPLSRLRSNFKGTNLIVVPPGLAFTLSTDLAQGFNAPRTAIPLNPANTFFVFVAIQNANAGDSTTIESVHLTT
jgi:hypothetical protein